MSWTTDDVQTADEKPTTKGVLNLDEVDENAVMAPLPTGLYPAMVVDAELTESKASGNDMIALTFEIRGADDPEINGRRLFYYIVLKDTGLQRLKKLVLAICNPGLDLTAFDPEECGEYFLGCEATLNIKQKMFEGRRVNNVVDVRAPSGGGFFG